MSEAAALPVLVEPVRERRSDVKAQQILRGARTVFLQDGFDGLP